METDSLVGFTIFVIGPSDMHLKRKATRLKPSTVIKRRNTNTEAACEFETSLSCREIEVRISLSVDLRHIFDARQLALMDYQAKNRIRLQIRTDAQSFRTMYKKVYNNTKAAILRRVAEYNSKVRTLLESYDFLRKASILIPLRKSNFWKAGARRVTYGTIVQLAKTRNTLSMDVISQDKRELVRFVNYSLIPRGAIGDVDLDFRSIPYDEE